MHYYSIMDIYRYLCIPIYIHDYSIPASCFLTGPLDVAGGEAMVAQAPAEEEEEEEEWGG